MNIELERIWIEAKVAYDKKLSQCMPTVPGEKDENSYSGSQELERRRSRT